ncbi:uncharacterized protein LOC135146205 isoform X2 [Zophobas morio]
MRNGDFSPTRIAAQSDAVNLVCGAKMQFNPENSLAVLSMANRPNVLCSLTQDVGKILHCIQEVNISGKIYFLQSLQISKLVLRHRPNKNQRQRIVAFVGSPVEDEISDLVKVAKILRKANISVDIINFGEVQNNEKLEKFVGVVDKDGTSHLLWVPGDSGVLSDFLVSSPVLGGDVSQFDEFGVDSNLDPDLAMVLRISAEEERERQEKAQLVKNSDLECAKGLSTNIPSDSPANENGQEKRAHLDSEEEHVDLGLLTEEEQIELAMKMSLEEYDQQFVEERNSGASPARPGISEEPSNGGVQNGKKKNADDASPSHNDGNRE